MIPDMSISLNVVSMAQVFWACFNRSAIRIRIRFILTLRSARFPPAGAEEIGADAAGVG